MTTRDAMTGHGISRRDVLAGAAGLALVPMAVTPARATPEAMAAAIANEFGQTGIKPGRVHIDTPRIAENGNSVQIVINVDSPMTAADHVKSITVFSEQNPIPTVVRFHLGPRAGTAQIATSIRLAATQRVHAIAAMSDGTCWFGDAEIIVTLAACLDGT